MGSGGGQMAGSMAQAFSAQQQAAQLQQLLDEAARKLAEDQARKQTGNPRPPSVRWNTLASQLEDRLRQGRGLVPPEQYRRAIERYFELIAAENA